MLKALARRGRGWKWGRHPLDPSLMLVCFRGRRDSGYQRQTAQINESIAQAFVKFLEEESVPHTPVVLPVLEMARSKQVSCSYGPGSITVVICRTQNQTKISKLFF